VELSIKPGPTGSRRQWIVGVCLFLAFLAFFVLCSSNSYMSVDGALRSLQVYQYPSLQFHGNNHLLYPFWVLTWSRALQLAGLGATDPFQFIRITEAMNSLLAAAVIAMIWTVMTPLAGTRVALLCSLIFGFSNALLLHATNAAEPMPGLYWSVLGIWLLLRGLEGERHPLLIAAGLVFALGLASYEAMGTIVGIGVFSVAAWTDSVKGSVGSLVKRLMWVCIGGVLGVCAIYGLAYAYQGIPVSRMPSQFLSLGAPSEVYGGFRLSHLLNLPFGLMRNLYSGIPPDYAGTRSLLRHPQRTFWIPVAMSGLGLLGTAAFLIGKGCWRASRPLSQPGRFVALAGFLLLFVPLLYWDPIYDKLWLLPLATIAGTIGVSLRPGNLEFKERRLLSILLCGLLLVQVGTNFPRVVARHINATPHLDDAKAVSHLARPEDWVVTDFDDISVLWMAFWGQNSRVLLLPSSKAVEAANWLDLARQDCARTGGQILFVGVLDQDRAGWDAFLGNRVGIPFAMLEPYREHAEILNSFPFGQGTVTVRSYRPSG
jgi:hypothetical protein